MACCLIKNVEIPECVSTIVIPTSLTNGTYQVTLTDRFNKKYNVDAEVDEDGFLIIDTSMFPVGVLTRYSGVSMLEVFSDCTRQVLNICDTEYGYITLTFYNSDSTGLNPYTDNTTFTLCCN